MPVSEDIYKQDVDFTALALQYPGFSKRLKPNGQLDFSDPESVRQLTKALLHRDFNLTIDLPEDRLCPPVPNRFNYIVFAQRLVDSTSFDYWDQSSGSNDRLIGLDIGTGASAIYPLLACRQRPTWAFLATEIDTKSRSYATRNIAANSLESRIKLLPTDETGQQLIPTTSIQQFDNHAIRILLTNPPFYTSQSELLHSARLKSRPPNSACTGAPVEMITPGGEVSFVSRLIHESTLPANNSKIQWFSSMLGKLSSVGEIIDRLQQANCSNYAVTEFVQGQRTRRWCVAWSWDGLRPPTSLARGISGLGGKVLPFPADFEFDVVDKTETKVGDRINSEIASLALEWRPAENPPGGVGRSVHGDVWSRKARRRERNDEEMRDVEDEDEDEDEREYKFAFRIVMQQKTVPELQSKVSVVHVRWVQGHDAVMFESFCGWLKRKVQS